MASKKRLYDLSPCKHFTRAWNSISSALRRNRNPPDRVPCDRRGHETGGLDVLGEITQVLRAGRPPLRRAHRLLHGRKTAFQHARSRELGGVGELARGLEGDQIDRDAQPPAELPPQVHRDTAVFAARRVLVHQQEISVVDADADLPRRGQLGARGGRRRHGAGAATETPRTACLSIALATNPEAFASSANSRRYFAPAARPCGVPIDCCTAEKRPSSTREPGSFSASVTRRGFNPSSTSSLSLTNSS